MIEICCAVFYLIISDFFRFFPAPHPNESDSMLFFQRQESFCRETHVNGRTRSVRQHNLAHNVNSGFASSRSPLPAFLATLFINAAGKLCELEKNTENH